MTAYLVVNDMTSKEFLEKTLGEQLYLLSNATWIEDSIERDKKVEVTEAKLREVCVRVIDLVMKKNADYGDAWQRQGINGVLVRLADKLYRIDNLCNIHNLSPKSTVEALVADENVEDTLIDAIGYCLLGLLYMQEEEDGR
jgi:hypothetical protein